MFQHKYSSTANRDFALTLKKRVNAYFKDNNLSRNSNAEMKIKSFITLGIYVLPFLFIVFGGIQNSWILLGLWITMGIGISLVGICIMHDAVHGSYSRHSSNNTYMGWVTYLLGMSELTWRIQHNVIHHSFTNVSGVDDDLDPRFFMRFSPHQPLRWFHRYQHIYAPLLYCAPVIMWVFVKDFDKFRSYQKQGHIPKGAEGRKLLAELVLQKLIYMAIVIVMPLFILDQPMWMTLTMIFIAYGIAGFILSSVFQLAHVMPTSKYVAEEETKIQENRMVHQLQTTSNFGMNSHLLTWLCGGLNFQIEHHLFPQVCHVHYPKLSKIVQMTTEEFDIEYNSQQTLASAFSSHLLMLKSLGRKTL